MVVAGTLAVLMAFTATYGVVRRYIFHSPEPYSYELSVMFLLLSFVLAVPALERFDRFIRVDIISSHLPVRANNVILNVLAPILGLVFCGVLAWKGGVDAQFALRVSQTSLSAWPVPLFPIKIVIPISYGLLCLVLIVRLCRGLVSLKAAPRR